MPSPYWLTDRCPNRTWTFSKLQNFGTPSYTSTPDPGGGASRPALIATIASCQTAGAPSLALQRPGQASVTSG